MVLKKYPDHLVTLDQLRVYRHEPFGVGREVERFLDATEELPGAAVVEVWEKRCRVILDGDEVMEMRHE